MQAQTNAKKADSADVKFVITITVKLLVICAVTALLLAGVNALTADMIAANLAREKSDAISSIFPAADKNEQLEAEAAGVTALYAVYSADSVIGYAPEASPLGFGGAMNLMVGINSDGTLAGVKLISHSETPGLGSRVGEEAHLSQYIGKDTSAVDAGVDIITGSTVSSNAVHAGVKSALEAFAAIAYNGGAE